MARGINLQQWQLEAHAVGITGKGTSGKIKFQGSSQDFSEDYDKRKPLKTNKFRPKAKSKTQVKNDLTKEIQRLKNNGYSATYIEVEGKPRTSLGGKVHNACVIVLNKFLFPNQIRRDYGKVLKFYYEDEKNDSFSPIYGGFGG